MPQLVRGGKYVFGWSVISEDGGILIPEEARQEYQFKSGERVILIPGSNTSGGFSIVGKSLLEQSRLSDILTQNPDLAEFRIQEGNTIEINGRKLCWVTIHGNGFLQLTPHVLEAYGVKPGDYLLAVRGSYLGLGMAVKGPLVEEARKHSGIAVFQPKVA
jgi:bifunctional DNA-binding transcriptional regulator/antitoxin component of YhaV-PrlF toxin-antitoxin module